MSFTLRMMTKEKKEKKIPGRHRHPPARSSLSPATSQTLQCIAYSHFCSTSSRLRKSPVICSISKPPPTRPLPPPPTPPPSKKMTFSAKALHLFETRRAPSSLTNGHSGPSPTGENVSRRAAFSLKGGGVIFCSFIHLFIYFCVRVADG